jgi:RNA polymerase sigma factor (sigma-70 family)
VSFSKALAAPERPCLSSAQIRSAVTSDRDHRQWLEELFPIVKRIVAIVARRFHLSSADAEDLVSTTMIKLADRDYHALRQFEGRSTIETFLTVIVDRACQDHVDKARGRYRSTVGARRLGEIAVWLEMYMKRDHMPFKEACAVLRAKHGVTLSDFELEQLAEQLPTRFRRRIEGEAALAGLVSLDSADALILEHERAMLVARAEAIIARTLATWPTEDAIIFRMRCSDGRQVADIARARQLEQKPLYRRIDELRARMCKALQDAGLTDDELLA